MRAAGYLIVFALVLVKTAVARLDYAAPAERHVLGGIWAGEVFFLILLAAYVTGLLAVTARRPPAGPAALGIGVRAGAACGLVFYVLPPIGHPLHLGNIWLACGYGVARVLASLAVLCALAAAGVAAGRRTSARGSRLPLADARARQGVAAGVCAGAAAAVLVSLLGVSTIALLPQEAGRLTWTLPHRHTLPGDVYNFEVGASDSAAGYLAVLVFFPLFGAGLGAWGGLMPRASRAGGPAVAAVAAVAGPARCHHHRARTATATTTACPLFCAAVTCVSCQSPGTSRPPPNRSLRRRWPPALMHSVPATGR